MMKTARFTNQCRACRRISPTLIPVLSKLEDFERLTIKQCLETSLGITCELSSNLPSKFCEMCLDELKITYVFTEKYKESDLYFKNIVVQAMKEQQIQKQTALEVPLEVDDEDLQEEECEIGEPVEETGLIMVHENENYGDEENVDVLEGYEELVLDENADWLEEQAEEQNENESVQKEVQVTHEEQEIEQEQEQEQVALVEEEIVDDEDSEIVFGELEDIIVEDIDESQLPSIVNSENIPTKEDEEEVQTENEPLKMQRFRPSSNVSTNLKKKMVFSIAEVTKSDGTPMEILEPTHYFEESDTTEDLEHINIAKRPKPLSLDDLERKNVIPMIKSILPSKIEGGSTVQVDGETFHKCDECDRRFTKRYLLKSHIKTVHLRIREHCCTMCPKQFTSKLRLEEHFRIHTGERPFKCDYCPMAFTTPTQRKLHSITHTRSNPYSCEYCGKTFSSHATLHGHKFIHTRQGVECPVCKKMFARQVDVKKHMAVHTKEKSFICKICDKGYLYNTSLKAHMKNHSFENVQCKDCEEDINNIDQWNYHQQLHAKEVFECTSCGTTFMEQHELFTHLRTAHSTLHMKQEIKKDANESWIDN